MATQLQTVFWITLSPEQRTRSGGCWPERCYPFRGVFAEEQMNRAKVQQSLFEDFRLAIKELEQELH
jgi:hypothetical protein